MGPPTVDTGRCEREKQACGQCRMSGRSARLSALQRRGNDESMQADGTGECEGEETSLSLSLCLQARHVLIKSCVVYASSIPRYAVMPFSRPQLKTN